MQTTDLTTPGTIDRVLEVLAWCLLVSGGLWIVTGVIGHLQRRAYNLTHAESGSSKSIKPDFLKVDHAKRDAAIGRGAAYDQKLAARETAPGPAKTVATVGAWSRVMATAAAFVGLAVTIIGTFQKIESFQAGVEEVGSWDRFVEIVRENQIGALIAAAVIAANIYAVMVKLRKSGD